MTSRDFNKPEQSDNPLRPLHDAIASKLSDKIAGGQRQDHRDFLPEVDLPGEGMIPEEFQADLHEYGMADMLALWRANDPNSMADLDLTPASGPGRNGKGGDWFRGSEAPNNFTNRHAPAYKARRDFAVSIHSDIEDMFGVSAGGSAGHMRQPHPSHKAPGGPSGNSDHYSGGAIDFFGPKENLDRLRDWLVEQEFVSFVRWQSESHYDHVHVSFDLGWVAQKAGQPVTLSPRRASTSKRTPSAALPRQQTPKNEVPTPSSPAPPGGRPS